MIDVNLIGTPAFSVEVVGDGFVNTGFNARLADLTGLRSAAVLGRSPLHCMPPEIALETVQRYRVCVETRQAIEAETRCGPPTGERWWNVTVIPVFDRLGAVTSLVGVLTDVTERKKAERDKRESDARMALALDVLDGGFWCYDLRTAEFDISPKLRALVAGDGADRLGFDDYAARVHPEDLDGVDISTMLGDPRDGAPVEYRVTTAEGDTRWLRCQRRLIRDERAVPERIIGVALDITEQKRVRDVYEAQATTDVLTGLRNRRGFDASAARFARAAAHDGSRFALVVRHLDRSTPVNDRHGHAVGDAVLRELATRLLRQVGPGDIVARLGGDEFAILVGSCEGRELTYLAQRLVLAAQRPVATPAGELSVGISIGIATSLPGDRDVAELVRRADLALYDVKLSGRGAWKLAA